MSQKKQIVAVACEKPGKYGIEMTHWNRDMLVKAVIEKGIVEWIAENPCDILAVKNVTRNRNSPLFAPKLSQKFLSNSTISTLIYND